MPMVCNEMSTAAEAVCLAPMFSVEAAMVLAEFRMTKRAEARLASRWRDGEAVVGGDALPA
jgi:hypothetical protein